MMQPSSKVHGMNFMKNKVGEFIKRKGLRPCPCGKPRMWKTRAYCQECQTDYMKKARRKNGGLDHQSVENSLARMFGKEWK